jgi:circadian clock protein KaiC
MPVHVPKSPTGITGLDELTEGGVPAGRSTLVCGGPGCGKTLLAITFLVRGALAHAEPGVFVSFDERAVDLGTNVASLGYDLHDLQQRNLLAIHHISLERENIEEKFRRLLDWLKERGLTTMITAERGDGGLTRHGIEE